ncbi:hypothetical protein ACR3K2_15380 [Cryptosporidium serpentis]
MDDKLIYELRNYKNRQNEIGMEYSKNNTSCIYNVTNSLRSQLFKKKIIRRNNEINSIRKSLDLDSTKHNNVSHIANQLRSSIYDSDIYSSTLNSYEKNIKSPTYSKSKKGKISLLASYLDHLEQLQNEQESMQLYYINKLRADTIRSNQISDTKNEFLPLIYTPLYPLQLLSLQELILLLIIYNLLKGGTNNNSIHTLGSFDLSFFFMENKTENQSSVILYGRVSNDIKNLLYTNDSCNAKIIISGARWRRIEKIISSEFDCELIKAVLILINPKRVNTPKAVIYLSRLLFICRLTHALSSTKYISK